MKLTTKEKMERTAIIKELSRLSRGGWSSATREDWAPLESRLDQLNAKRDAKRDSK